MRMRSLVVLAVLVAVVGALLLPSGSAQAGFARCFKITVPVVNGMALAALYDDESEDLIFLNATDNESNDEIVYYIAVDDTQVATVFSWPEGAVAYGDDIPGWGGWALWSENASIEEVEYEGHCRPAILDGRLNKFDLGTLAYVYPDGTGYSVWELNLADMKGYEMFSVSAADVAAAKTAVTELGANQQIGTSTERGTSLWALVGGQCQLNSFEQDGKINEFVFDCA